MTMQLGPEMTGTPPESAVYAVRVWTWLGRRWRWAAWDGVAWSSAEDMPGAAARMLIGGRIDERMRARVAPSRWRRIMSQDSVADALRAAGVRDAR